MYATLHTSVELLTHSPSTHPHTHIKYEENKRRKLHLWFFTWCLFAKSFLVIWEYSNVDALTMFENVLYFMFLFCSETHTQILNHNLILSEWNRKCWSNNHFKFFIRSQKEDDDKKKSQNNSTNTWKINDMITNTIPLHVQFQTNLCLLSFHFFVKIQFSTFHTFAFSSYSLRCVHKHKTNSIKWRGNISKLIQYFYVETNYIRRLCNILSISRITFLRDKSSFTYVAAISIHIPQ